MRGGARARRWALVWALPWLPGCQTTGFACTDDASCRDGDQQGMCEPDGACSFPDPSCPSGRRYGEHTGGDAAGACVPPANAGTDASTAVPPTTDASASTTPETGEVTDGSTGGSESLTGATASDSATTATTTTTAMTSAATTDDGSTGEPTGDAYGQCLNESDCPQSAKCEPLGALPMTCAPSCQDDTECPPALSGTALSACSAIDGDMGWCVLRCSRLDTCPDGMECTDWEQAEYGTLCTWF